MTNTLSMSIRLGVVILFTVFSAQAQEPTGGWEPPSEAQSVLVVRASTSGAGGANFISGSFPLLAGEFSGMVLTPAFDKGGDLCTGSVMFSMNPGDLDLAPIAWHIEGRLLEMKQGVATVDLRWTRAVNRTDLVPSDRLSWQQRVAMREGDRGVIDIVRRQASSGTGCDSFALTYEVQFSGAATLSKAAIGYDLWLVQRGADGEVVTDHFVTSAQQGDAANYFFRQIAYGVDGRREDRAPKVKVGVSGSIRGRARTDGRIDLTVDGEVVAVDPGQSSAVGRRGRTLLTVRPGETVEVEAVQLAGRLRGVGDVGEIFANHRTAIRITARRLW
jgi:hypothetical protein